MLSKNDLYEIYQKNLLAANNQLSIVEEICKSKRAEYYYFKEHDSERKNNALHDYISSTRLYAFLLGNWYEIKLYKLIYDNSSAAFDDSEIAIIKGKQTISDRWKEVYRISLNKVRASGLLEIAELEIREIDRIISDDYFTEIDDLILTRNRLAHGQWDTQLNNNQTNLNPLNFLVRYKTYNHLRLLRNKLDNISKIIECLVVFKDKTSETFNNDLTKYLKEIEKIETRILNADDRKDAKSKINQLLNQEKMKRLFYK
ncbi:hypothetical protein [Staphylococcus sp. LKG3-3]|uniref:hypothetical protein n=1 Tax=Staphylococcus sp. LKG3-3 TaxID=3399685 RepID=UPI003D54044F